MPPAAHVLLRLVAINLARAAEPRYPPNNHRYIRG
jgi:hypothetical protein